MKNSRLLAVLCLLSACSSSREGGIAVSLSLHAHTTDDSNMLAQVPLTVESSGAPIEIESAYLVISSAELRPCAEAASLPGALRRMFRSVAHAHSSSSGIRIGTPQVIDVSGDNPHAMLSFAPLPGTYCTLEIGVGPIDQDAISDADLTFLVGHSLWITASGRELKSQASQILSFDLKEKVPEGLALSAETRNASITLSLRLDQWFQDVSSLEGAEAQVFSNVVSALTLSTVE